MCYVISQHVGQGGRWGILQPYEEYTITLSSKSGYEAGREQSMRIFASVNNW